MGKDVRLYIVFPEIKKRRDKKGEKFDKDKNGTRH
jgi:hypothetical protein